MALKDKLTSFTGTASALGLSILQSKGAEPQMSYKWKVFMPKIGGIEPITQAISSFPFPSFDSNSVHVGSSLQYFPGTESVSPLSLVIFQDSKGNSLSYFNMWKALIKNSDGTHNYPSSYKKTIELKLQDKLDTEVFSLKCLGVWPISIDPLSLDYDASDYVKLNVTFSVDRVVMKQKSSGLTGILSTITGGNITSFI